MEQGLQGLGLVETVNSHPTVEEIVLDLLDGLRKAVTLEEVNLVAGIAHQQMADVV